MENNENKKQEAYGNVSELGGLLDDKVELIYMDDKIVMFVQNDTGEVLVNLSNKKDGCLITAKGFIKKPTMQAINKVVFVEGAKASDFTNDETKLLNHLTVS